MPLTWKWRGNWGRGGFVVVFFFSRAGDRDNRNGRELRGAAASAWQSKELTAATEGTGSTVGNVNKALCSQSCINTSESNLMAQGCWIFSLKRAGGKTACVLRLFCLQHRRERSLSQIGGTA